MKITKCRSCGSLEITKVIDLGELVFTGIFPGINENVQSGEIKLVLCKTCNLIQTDRDFDRSIMYGNNYGYRSGLNFSMVSHLKNKAKILEEKYLSRNDDLIIDIGSNDGTFLNAFSQNYVLVGCDPTINKFKEHYSQNIIKIANFFDDLVLDQYFAKKATLITSISMFYDLPDPCSFTKKIAELLEVESGVWHFEQAYWPSTFQTLGYDTICHEHLEYYTLKSLIYILNSANLKIIDLSFNEINGGSFAITASHKASKYPPISANILDWFIENESQFSDEKALINFSEKMLEHSASLKKLLKILKNENKRIFGLGASTKGNVLLQYCQIDFNLIEKIGEINSDKFGKFTPGTRIPIVSQEEVFRESPDYILILPWHFKNGMIQTIRGQSPTSKIIIPLPTISIL